jgi:large subunit ribosomal protein L24
LSSASVDSKDADLSLSGNLDLTDGSIDARVVLSGSGRATGARPDIFMALQGPVVAPARSIDVSALAGWLTLRAVENQTRQLRAIESAPAKPAAPPSEPKSELAPALPPPIDIRPVPAQ